MTTYTSIKPFCEVIIPNSKCVIIHKQNNIPEILRRNGGRWEIRKKRLQPIEIVGKARMQNESWDGHENSQEISLLSIFPVNQRAQACDIKYNLDISGERLTNLLFQKLQALFVGTGDKAVVIECYTKQMVMDHCTVTITLLTSVLLATIYQKTKLLVSTCQLSLVER